MTDKNDFPARLKAVLSLPKREQDIPFEQLQRDVTRYMNLQAGLPPDYIRPPYAGWDE